MKRMMLYIVGAVLLMLLWAGMALVGIRAFFFNVGRQLVLTIGTGWVVIVMMATLSIWRGRRLR